MPNKRARSVGLNDPFAALFQLAHYRINHLLGLVHGEIARVDIGRKDCNIPFARPFRDLWRRGFAPDPCATKRECGADLGGAHLRVVGRIGH